ncbi:MULTISPECIES: aspartate-alanine antiporter [Paraburkholderia]|jgi:aspartate-alanine antiporter|uniref:Aspartate-alanine antiporter n=1 Tax=Paraburkholderia largidicola TaxID=3014751 RepID=A0A7I8BM22_9BURK|nr:MULTISPECIES: aspartate-alanine antiporter [Paraburkholderia]BEU22457.1 aspartate-alanine antiporter [Paraburkholderia sp. 22B1P]GJH35619.1 aspartate-alanine antiporter [Paraburkholderia hospita]CAG9242419.1 putative transport protein [Paraburkholderia caribensis]BCF89493.1 aspartate-alanine antiporter [Paraburkholderia sp. PGU16]GJH05496.1 aspartate-alanine antiporter [Paraburkholderia terrae]
MDLIHSIFHKSPEIALFLSLAVGYFIGQINFGKFQLGGVGGSLLAAVVISQAGVSIDNGVKAVMFAVFIYAVGYDSGPGFFNSLNRKTLREIAMALFLAISALITVLICAKIFHLNKGLAAGLAGGALTQSAIIGTAGDAIARLGLPADEVKSLQSDVAIAYAVTYVFGSLGAIIVCVNILPKFMGRDLRSAALDAEAKLAGGTPSRAPGQLAALPELVGRAFKVGPAAGRKVSEIEMAAQDFVSIEKIRRAGKEIEPGPNVVLAADDIVLVVGRREGMVPVAPRIGTEISDVTDVSAVMQTRQAVFTAKGLNHTTIQKVRETVDRDLRHGVFLESITRVGQPVPILPETKLEHGDVLTYFGSAKDTKRAVAATGYELPYSIKTDFIYMGIGMVIGLLIGLVVVNIGGVPLTLGSGGGCLLAGLVFGWMRGKHPMYGVMPPAASRLLQDFGLAAFVSVVGLNSGLQAVTTIKQLGVTIFLLGVVVTLVPLLLTMLFGRYVLRYDNAAILAGALSGSRSANPAFGGVLDKAESAVPTVPFAITYAIANVLLTLLGPLVVGLV